MRRMGRTLMLIAGTLATPVLHADPVCILAPGAQELLEAAGPIGGWSCEPIRSGGWQDRETDADLLKKVGKWELKLLDTGEQHNNRTRMSFGTKGLRLKVTL